ncbi:MAG: hypothetical protein MJ002_02815 [Paludibacteraceae bacterium]|nr:hypothetical protein [Paludibacteraceae bacterium]
MKKRIINIAIVVVVAAILIAVATWLTLPAEEYHMLLHRNIFENIAYLDDDTEVQLPIEVMLADFHVENTTTDNGIDTLYTFSLLLQPTGNTSPEYIKDITLQPLQTETYKHYDIYIDEFIYNEAEGRLIVFIKLERRRYQLLLNTLNSE